MKLGRTSRQDKASAPKYRAVAIGLLKTARDLDTMAELKYGNGLAIIAIHAAIAYADALSIAYRALKSTDGNHRRAADVLANALGNRAVQEQIDRLSGILDSKTHVSYSGNFYTLEDGRRLLKEVEKFAEWAEQLYTNRP